MWMTFVSNFGWKPRIELNTKSPLSLKFAVTLSCLLGTLIWAYYKASLTSELAVRFTKLPFDSFEGLQNTDHTFVQILLFFPQLHCYSITVSPY
jgi:hypothetical protein